MECRGMGWIGLGLGRERCRGHLNAIRRFGFHKMQGIS